MPKRLTLRTSNSTRSVLEHLLPLFESDTRIEVDLIVLSSRIALETIENGERADLAILQDSAIDKLASAGILDGGASINFANSLIGLGCLEGVDKPDISTPERFKQVLLQCRTIAHTQFGPSGRYFPEMVEQMGVAEQMLPKTVTRSGGYIGGVVVNGEAELAFQQVCELLAVPGLSVIGRIPDELQRGIVTKAGIFACSSNRDEATALLEFLARPEHKAAFDTAGLEKLI